MKLHEWNQAVNKYNTIQYNWFNKYPFILFENILSYFTVLLFCISCAAVHHGIIYAVNRQQTQAYGYPVQQVKTENGWLPQSVSVGVHLAARYPKSQLVMMEDRGTKCKSNAFSVVTFTKYTLVFFLIFIYFLVVNVVTRSSNV